MREGLKGTLCESGAEWGVQEDVWNEGGMVDGYGRGKGVG